MKKSKILVPAIALLCVSTAAAVTGTVAWFSTNGVVTAKSMKVRARSAKNLLILQGEHVASEEGWSEEAEAASKTDAYMLTPVSTKDCASFFKVKRENEKDVDYTTGQMKVGAIIEAATNAADDGTDAAKDGEGKYIEYDYAKYVFTLKAESSEESFAHINVKEISVARGTETSDISKALRIGVKSGDSYYIYSVTEGAVTYQAVTKAGTVTAVSGWALTVDDATGSESITAKTAASDEHDLGELEANEVKKVEIYVWYEGQDENCTSLNSQVIEDLNLTVKFEGVNA